MRVGTGGEGCGGRRLHAGRTAFLGGGDSAAAHIGFNMFGESNNVEFRRK